MKMSVSVRLNLKLAEAKEQVRQAARLGLRDVAGLVQKDAIRDSPVLTGNNRRSIGLEVSGMGTNEVVDPAKIEAAVYSTSGYGGFLETGTVNKNGSIRMPAHPYFKPALDRNFTPNKVAEAIKGHLK